MQASFRDCMVEEVAFAPNHGKLRPRMQMMFHCLGPMAICFGSMMTVSWVLPIIRFLDIDLIFLHGWVHCGGVGVWTRAAASCVFFHHGWSCSEQLLCSIHILMNSVSIERTFVVVSAQTFNCGHNVCCLTWCCNVSFGHTKLCCTFFLASEEVNCPKLQLFQVFRMEFLHSTSLACAIRTLR